MTPKTKEQYLEEIKGILNEAAGLPLEQYAELCEEVYLEAGTRQDNVEDEIGMTRTMIRMKSTRILPGHSGKKTKEE
jgi:hypothetical protein